jgi:hypothetical protein
VFTPEELGVSPQIFFKITLSEVVAQLTHEERGRNKRSDGAHYTLEQKGDVVFQSSNAAGGEEKVPRLSGVPPPPLLLPLPVALPYKGAARRVPPPPTVAGSETVSGRLILRS